MQGRLTKKITRFKSSPAPALLFQGCLSSLRSWRYQCGCEIKVLAAGRVPKKGSRDEAVFLAASPLVTAPPSNLTRLYYNGSAAKSHLTTIQYRQLRRLVLKRP